MELGILIYTNNILHPYESKFHMEEETDEE